MSISGIIVLPRGGKERIQLHTHLYYSPRKGGGGAQNCVCICLCVYVCVYLCVTDKEIFGIGVFISIL